MGVSQPEFGELFGVSDRMVRYWESGEIPVPPKHRPRIVEALEELVVDAPGLPQRERDLLRHLDNRRTQLRLRRVVPLHAVALIVIHGARTLQEVANAASLSLDRKNEHRAAQAIVRSLDDFDAHPLIRSWRAPY